MNGHRIGYIRVSSVDQNTDRQLEGIELDQVFTDKASGKDLERPQLEGKEKMRQVAAKAYAAIQAKRAAKRDNQQSNKEKL